MCNNPPSMYRQARHAKFWLLTRGQDDRVAHDSSMTKTYRPQVTSPKADAQQLPFF